MQKKRFGKIVSFIVAVVMILGIMIPATTAIAQTSKYSGITSWTKVSTYKELKDALAAAKTGNPVGETQYIKLTDDINTDSFVVYKSANVGASGVFESKDVYFAGLTAKVTSIKKNGTAITDLNAIRDTKFFNSKYFSSMGSGSTPINRSVGITSDSAAGFGLAGDSRFGTEFDSHKLVVREKTSVVIDLNGKKITGVYGSANVYNTSPAYQMSVFTVEGSLTVTDLSTGSAVGSITGGSGTANASKKSVTEATGKSLYFDSNWNVTDKASAVYEVVVNISSYWYGDADSSKGGGIYVADTGKFYLENGQITGNSALMSRIAGAGSTIYKASNAAAYAYGGGVYVENGGYFEMTGGAISKNAVRAYQKGTASLSVANATHAYGGGVYLDKNATMNFINGKIVENATFAQTSDKNRGSVSSYGGGIYVASTATLNMMGDAEVMGFDIRAKMTTKSSSGSFKDLPQVSANMAGGQTGETNASATNAKGAGIYNEGTINIKKAVVSANTFSEYSNGNVVSIIYDPEKGVPVEANNTDTLTALGVTARADEANAPYATKTVANGTNGKYAVRSASGNIVTDGAGIYNNGNMYIGQYAWLFDNWDFVTNGTSVGSTAGSYSRTYETKDDFLMYQDGHGRAAYEKAEKWSYGSKTSSTNDGYGWFDTRDDVYLPSSKYLYIADTLYETKVGINYDEGMTSNSNRVIVKATESTLDAVWGRESYIPMARDLQFFFANDDNSPTAGNLKTIQDLDYVVVWDYSNYGTSAEPVLRFEKRDYYNKNRNAYWTFNFSEANKTYFIDGNNKDSDENWLSEEPVDFLSRLSWGGFSCNYKLIPDYSVYKGDNWKGLIGNVGDYNSIQKVTVHGKEREASDLYFKGWQFYEIYGNSAVIPNKPGETSGVTHAHGLIKVPNGNRVGSTSYSAGGATFYTWDIVSAMSSKPQQMFVEDINYQLAPSFVASWYTAEELEEARTRVSNVKAQRVILADGSEAIRLLALVDNQYASYKKAGFVVSTTNATPTIEGGYDYSEKTRIYKRVLTKTADGNESWLNVYAMANPANAPAGTIKVDWSEFENAAGILYTNLIINDDNKATTFYVTPYAYDGKTYYYGQSRAISYAWLTQQDASAPVQNG